MKTLYFIRRHWIKFTIALLTAFFIIVMTTWAANRFRKKEDRAEQVRIAILECTTPGTPNNPHSCFDKVQAQSQQRNSTVIQHAIEVLAIDNDCRLRRTLWGMPAPEERDGEGRLIPCPEQTPSHIYPGDGRPPPL